MTWTRLRQVAFPALLVISVTMGAVITIWRQQTDFPGPLMQPANVVVPHGSIGQVAEALAAAGVIRNAVVFRIVATLTGADGAVHAGEFAFPSGATLHDVLRILRTSRPVAHRVTIPEGLTAQQIGHLLRQTDSLSGDAPIPAEGSVLPETYAFDRAASRASVLDQARTAMARTLDAVWSQRDAGVKLASPQQLLTLASIVERETARADERPRIAGVFLNRLRLGMRLQSDPTVIYAASAGAGTLPHPLTRAELETPSPYNTYTVSGLPPGPIDSPGIAALEAVAHPTATDALYFVADGSGGHVFAATLEEHQRNVLRWRNLNAAPTTLPVPPAPPTTPPAVKR